MGAKSVLEKVVTREPQYTMLLANLMATNPDVCECVIQCLAGQYAFPKHTKAKILCESPFKLLPNQTASESTEDKGRLDLVIEWDDQKLIVEVKIHVHTPRTRMQKKRRIRSICQK